MSDTNINAYHTEVEAAGKALAVATNNYELAKRRLAEKKAELGIVDEPTEGELVESPDKGIIGEIDPTHVPELPQAGDVIKPTEQKEKTDES